MPGRPDPPDRPSNHFGPGDRAEEATVPGVAPVVAHDPQLAGLDPDRRKRAGQHAWRQVRLVEVLTVDIDVPAAPFDHLAREADDPLDEVRPRLQDADRLG